MRLKPNVYPAELFALRQWERRSKINSDYRVWLRLSIMLLAIIAAAFLATR